MKNISFPILKTQHISNYKNQYLQKDLYDLFYNISKKCSKNTQDSVNSFCLKFNYFLGLINKKLNTTKFLNNKNTSKILSMFVSYYKEYNPHDNSERTQQKILSCIDSLINCINKDYNKKLTITEINFDLNNIDINNYYYLKGWIVESQTNRTYLNLQNYYKKFGEKETEKLYLKVKNYFNNKNRVKPFTEFHLFIQYFIDNGYNPNNINYENLIKNFIKFYFENIQNKELSIENAKGAWNYLITFLKDIYNLNNELVFKIPKKTDPRSHKITKRNGQLYKTKMITEIPLQITDEESISILSKKVKQDIDLINDWSDYVINRFIENLDQNTIAEDEVSLTIKELALKRLKKYDGISQNMLYNKKSLLKREEALAIAYKLIINHPEITESFILNIDYLDDEENVIGFKEIDSNYYLIGYKKRRCNNNAQQKILLNEETTKLIKLLIKETEKIRKYLTKEKSPERKKLFLFFNTNNTIINSTKNLNSKITKHTDIVDSMSTFYTKKGLDKKDSSDFINKISFNKLRANAGMKVYFETESTTKMSEALGHKKYDANLLSHYLPEPVLEFFQNRWIRLFQKGIICEAMKESKFLLKASGFLNMEELDLFLKNHTLKNIPNNKQENKENVSESELYISMNEERINALLSIMEAVDKEKEYNINDKAYYWSIFTKRLIKEINNNKSYLEFKEMLENAKAQTRPDLFKEIIRG